MSPHQDVELGEETPKGPSNTTAAPIVSLQNVSLRFPGKYHDVAVLDSVSLDVFAGECLAIVGESGCGKSLLGLTAADLVPASAVVKGRIEYGDEVLKAGRDRRRRGFLRRGVHGRGVGIVYQDALTSLNPGMSIRMQLEQVCRESQRMAPTELLDIVRLKDSDRILGAKPYQLSGGERQRVLIALAMAKEPPLIVADEPTTALDVTVQAEIVQLLRALHDERHFGLIFISHDLALVRDIAQRTAVMYAGQVVEVGNTDQVLTRPRHPYSRGLLDASLSLERGEKILSTIPGQVGAPEDFRDGCRFRDRCFRAQPKCTNRPDLCNDGHTSVACFFPLGTGDGDCSAGSIAAAKDS